MSGHTNVSFHGDQLNAASSLLDVFIAKVGIPLMGELVPGIGKMPQCD